MAEETKTPEQIAAEQAAATAAAEAAKGADGTGKTLEELQAELASTATALKQANRESADRRKRLKELEDAETARQQAEMTETDKLKQELEALKADNEAGKAKIKETIIRSAFVAEAAKANVAHPEDVYLLADRSAVSLDEETGKVEGVAEAVKVLIDAGRVPVSGKPLAANLDGGAGSGGNNGKAVKLTAEELETARKMNIPPEKYAAQKAAIAAERAV